MTGPQDHPDPDLLADLAAEVLPDDVAQRVETHVVDCVRCSELLTEAERVRVLLRSDDAGPMPRDVAERLEAALTALRADGRADVPETDGTRSLTPLMSGGGGGPETSARLRRATGSTRVRRQALEEGRSQERTGRGARRLLATAAAVVMVAGGGLALRAADILPSRPNPEAATSADAGDGGRAESSTEEGAAGGPGPLSADEGAAPAVLATGTEYTGATLDDQARRLIETARRRAASEPQDAVESKGSVAARDAPSGTVAPEPGAGATSGGPPADARAKARPPLGNQTLRSAVALRACLDALNVPATQPVAVDLARYEGRDSAVLVLAGPSGSYDVWVVARDCRPGADGTVQYTTVAP